MARRLLIVDDSALVTSALRLLFEESGFVVDDAGDVASAVAAARTERPDIMLLDLTLPDGDGFAVLDALRASDALPHATLALTGHDDDALRARCLEAGCVAVLVKPVSVRELLALVRSL
jgi:DNA-binding response OmpR family regulator